MGFWWASSEPIKTHQLRGVIKDPTFAFTSFKRERERVRRRNKVKVKTIQVLLHLAFYHCFSTIGPSSFKPNLNLTLKRRIPLL